MRIIIISVCQARVCRAAPCETRARVEMRYRDNEAPIIEPNNISALNTNAPNYPYQLLPQIQKTTEQNRDNTAPPVQNVTKIERNIPKPRLNIPKPGLNIPKPRPNIPKPRPNFPKPRLNIPNSAGPGPGGETLQLRHRLGRQRVWYYIIT